MSQYLPEVAWSTIASNVTLGATAYRHYVISWAEFGYMWLTLIYLPLYSVAKFVIRNNNFYWIEVFAIYLIGISLIIIRI